LLIPVPEPPPPRAPQPGDPSFDGGRTVVTDRFVFFWNPPSPFSQWTRSHFEVGGVHYTHAEQFMMAEKARVFGDEQLLALILAATEPGEQKRLGRSVRGFDPDTWSEHRIDIVTRGNRAKFRSTTKLRDALLDTGDRTLVEASPYDIIWGIGLRADHPDATVPSRWRGQNLLGQVLMAVRDEIRAAPEVAGD